jgi:cbb3-type cytochrome oxidase subunit 3
MVPQLIDKKVLKKLLYKGYHQTDTKYFYEKKLKHIYSILKEDWYIFLLIFFIIIIFFNLYSHNKKKKEDKERMENIKLTTEEDTYEEPSFGYEGEYYKMLPRVTNSPDIIPYMY